MSVDCAELEERVRMLEQNDIRHQERYKTILDRLTEQQTELRKITDNGWSKRLIDVENEIKLRRATSSVMQRILIPIASHAIEYALAAVISVVILHLTGVLH